MNINFSMIFKQATSDCSKIDTQKPTPGNEISTGLKTDAKDYRSNKQQHGFLLQELIPTIFM